MRILPFPDENAAFFGVDESGNALLISGVRKRPIPVGDFDTFPDRNVHRAAVRVIHLIAEAGCPLLAVQPCRSVEKEQIFRLAVHPDSLDFERQLLRGTRAENDAGAFVILIGADQVERYAVAVLDSPGDAVQTVRPLIGPAAFAVSGDAVGEIAVRVTAQINRPDPVVIDVKRLFHTGIRRPESLQRGFAFRLLLRMAQGDQLAEVRLHFGLFAAEQDHGVFRTQKQKITAVLSFKECAA
ncbi:MAG: hypothetical protein BWY31_04299 [Lentisphaerae bacterium ADurb.Bin242]|nr:MAG: hypothetical protein BWY31_04299 [Lentisphaerae bacterium ADurb.Bin242]